MAFNADDFRRVVPSSGVQHKKQAGIVTASSMQLQKNRRKPTCKHFEFIFAL
jgi:hypothetical protein